MVMVGCTLYVVDGQLFLGWVEDDDDHHFQDHEGPLSGSERERERERLLL